jgi:hypothetical protein
MNDSAHTVKEAAVRLLLGEMGPLLDRVDAVSKVMQDGHALFEGDMHALGVMMSRLEAVLQDATESATLLQQQQQHAARAQLKGQFGPASRLTTAHPPSLPVKYLLACCVASSALVLGGMLIFDRATLEHARVGRAVAKSLPYLDPVTRQKLDAALQKSNQ